MCYFSWPSIIVVERQIFVVEFPKIEIKNDDQNLLNSYITVFATGDNNISRRVVSKGVDWTEMTFETSKLLFENHMVQLCFELSR